MSASPSKFERLREAREAARSRLDLSFAPDLPVSEAAAELRDALAANQVVVVAGETGSGKTTQLPKLLLEAGLGVGGMIAHTQPRRLAARTVAKRIAEEVGCELGAEVGFAVRFSDQTDQRTLLRVMTDGLLLTEIRSDRLLRKYDAVIIDEAHERSLNIDFLLGYLKRLLDRRQDLKVVVTSATIDVERFAAFFGNAPVVSVGGRTYPVELVYRDPADEDPLSAVAGALDEIEAGPHRGARDVLVFFPGEREIFEAARYLRRQYGEALEILPLYARLSFAEQRKIFAPSGSRRRVVLATNVAETSLTVPNIGYVIDLGVARINRYSYRSKLQRLPIEPIAQASADQRKGRCGRVAPGVCYRLYSEQDLAGRPEFTDAEIHRVNLASVVLQMQAFRLGDISRFPFLEPPDPRAVKDAYRLLEELKALEQGKLTEIGRAMARMPVDPRLARMLVEASRQGAVNEVLIVASALAVQDPRERPLTKRQAADEAHARYADEKSDFVTFLKLWRWLEAQRQELTRNRFNSLLGKRFLNAQRIREWREVHRQLLLVCRDLGFKLNSTEASYGAIHESILAGSLSLIGLHDERGSYLGARNLKMRIFPGSGLAGRTPKWIVAGEIAETSRVYARQVAAVEAGWIERQASHLVKSQYSAPFWSLARGEVMAHKSVSLYGLRLAEKRQVSYAKIDRSVSRDLFIREGLVAGRVKAPPDFLEHNLRLAGEVEELEAKGRRRDLLASDDDLFAFYDKRLPEDICRVHDLVKWLRRANQAEQNALYMDTQVLLRNPEGNLAEADYPSELVIDDDVRLQLKYRFAPGAAEDGVTVMVPVGLLPALNAEVLEWSVPGYLGLVVEQWLRSLPKQRRRMLVPFPDKVAEFTGALLKPGVYRQGRFLSALAGLLKDRYRVAVSEADWDRERIDPHLKIRVVVHDEAGKTLASGRDLRDLKKQLTAEDHQDAAPRRDMTGLTAFPQVTIEHQEIHGGAAAATVKYPGFEDQQSAVALRLFDSSNERDRAHRRGLSRLALFELGKVGGYFRRELDKHPQLGLHFATLGDAQTLKDELLRNVVWYCFFEDRPLPQTAQAFSDRLHEHRGELGDCFNVTVGLFAEALSRRFECRRELDGLTSKAYAQSRADIEAHLERLVPPDVLAQTPARYLTLVPRFLLGIHRRLSHLPGHVPQDIRIINELQPFSERLERIRSSDLCDLARFQDLRMLVEELRLARFAEPVARVKVSPHPLDRAYFGAGWKASAKRVADELKREEQRLGLA